MQNIQDMFTHMVRTIIQQELNEIQLEQFSIEGEEAIISLFSIGTLPQYDSDKDLVPDFGISPAGLDLEAVGATFLDVISVCYNFIKGGEEVTNTVLVDLLCNKYKSSLNEITKLL